jgi:hypothetical protein
MYILVNNSRMILGLFSNKIWLNKAIEIVRKDTPETILYYQEVYVDTFDSVLPNFWTIHPEKLIEIERDKDYV